MVAVTEMCATWSLICHLLIAKKASGGAPYRQRHPYVRFKRKKMHAFTGYLMLLID